jgi:hypothetical protein
MGKGIKHYFRDGTEHKGGMHKMADGTLHSKNSKKLFHMNELSKTSQAKARKKK